VQKIISFVHQLQDVRVHTCTTLIFLVFCCLQQVSAYSVFITWISLISILSRFTNLQRQPLNSA